MSRRLLLACLLLPCTLQAEPAGPQPIEMPDIRANIIKMLQEGQHEGMEVGEETFRDETKPTDEDPTPSATSKAPVSTPVQVPPGETDLFSIADEQKKTGGDTEPASVPPDAKPEIPAAEKKEEQHLYLPSKEITIQDADDLKKLLREFEEARKRQQGR